MSVSAISSVGSNSQYEVSKVDNSRQLESLNNEKVRLQQELSEIQKNGFISKNEKNAKIQELSSKINNISTKIQNLSKSEWDNNQQRFDNKSEKKSLNSEKVKLQSEISEINSSKTLTALEKTEKVQKLLLKINSISQEIQGLTSEEYNDKVNIFGSNNNDKKTDLAYPFTDKQEKEKQEIKPLFLNRVNIKI